MIVREWRGWTERDNAEDYPEHFRSRVAPELKALSGFLSAELCRRVTGDSVEFVVLSRWRSLDAIRAFAGDDIGRAVVEPGAIAALEGFDESVRHYEEIDTVLP
jgi:heme-degrading monooxygenase HmoA